MTIISRVSRLFRADVHGILDCLEDPQEVVKQAIRDMESEIERKEKELADLTGRIGQCAQESSQAGSIADEIERQIDLCFEASNDTLARSLIKKRLENEKRIRFIDRRSAELATRKLGLEKHLNEQREQLERVSQKLKVMISQPKIVPAHGAEFTCAEAGVTEEDVEVAFLEERSRRGRANSQLSS